ncbi:GAF domain-containing protein [Pseudonocardia aurantiaca]|uniref:GAF domain-containing protein n=1 Tax=Pseudonocardia aurantiaca TaxID=75290 RepID=A0ABW4FLV0_9PSEU
MTYDPAGSLADALDNRFVAAPSDPAAHHRVQRLRALGLGTAPDPEFDELAAKIARMAGTPYAMVNFVLDTHQFFAGLYEASSTGAPALEAAQAAARGPVARTMDLEHGFCPHVVDIKHALVLDDVCAWPRFAGNPVVDEIGIRSYIGAPLVDSSGMVLGTVCAISSRQSTWGSPGVEMIKSMAAEAMELIARRERGGS